MITPSYAVTATERVLPRMALDFTTGVLDPRVTVTRALNTATRINSSGLVEIVNANLPRFDYDPVTLAPKGLLIEEARTNLAQQSSDYNTGFWSKTSVSLTTGIDDPAGGTSATTLTATSAFGLIQQAVAGGVSGTTYSASFWIRRRTGTGQISLRCGDLTLIPITVTSSWVRYTVTAVASTATVRLAVVLTTSGDAVDVWGAQIEAGAFATSYIPTLASQVTRNADVVSMTGTNFSDWFNASEGTLACEFGYIGPPKANGAVASINNNTTSNRLLSVEVGTTSGLIATSTSGFSGATIAAMVIGNTYSTSLGVNTTQFAFAYNGNATTQQAGTINATAMTQLEFGGLAGQSTRVQNIYLKNCYYYPQRLTNNEIRATSK
jgi:hypothetical protein